MGGLTRKPPLVQIAGNLTAQRYVDEVLFPHVAPLAAVHGGTFVYMTDNARPHRETAYLAGEVINRIVWPTCSPDLNPLEHIWDQLKRSVYPHINANSNMAHLSHLLRVQWNAITQQRVRQIVQHHEKTVPGGHLITGVVDTRDTDLKI